MKTKILQITCDESRQTKDRFMILGGLVIENNNIEMFEKTMHKYRRETKMFAELKWSKVSSQKYIEYQKFIDFFFALNNSDNLHFKAMIIDTHKINYKKYSSGNKEVGFYKF